MVVRGSINAMFPRRINIQTLAGCNAKCIFCPSPQVTGKIPMGRMDWDLFRKIVDECAEHDMERVNPFSQNEPLLDNEIAKRVAYIKKRCGDRVTVLVISNGSLLTDDLMNGFIDAGLDRLKISLQGFTRETYERTMVTLKHENTYSRVERAIGVLHRRNVKKPRLSVSTVTTGYNEKEVRKWKRYWRRRGIKGSASACENRGGNIDKENNLFPYGFASKIGCRRSSVTSVVCYNGDVLLCCVDWWRTQVMGNLKEQTLQEIWTSQRMQEIRRGHAEKDAKILPQICRDCRVSYFASRQHFSLRGIRDRLKIFFGQDQFWSHEDDE